jgi:hypothetical protein
MFASVNPGIKLILSELVEILHGWSRLQADLRAMDKILGAYLFVMKR